MKRDAGARMIQIRSEAEARQRRPARVAATSRPRGGPRLVRLPMIPAAARRRRRDDVGLPDPPAVGPRIPSVIRTAKIATVEALRALVARQLGL